MKIGSEFCTCWLFQVERDIMRAMRKAKEIPAIPAEKPRHGERAALIRKLALKYPELGPADLAKRVGCTRQSARVVLSSFMSSHSNEELIDFQSSKADVYDAIQFRALECVTQAKLSKASAPALMMVAGTAEDKARLIRGQATSFNVNVLLDVASMIRRENE